MSALLRAEQLAIPRVCRSLHTSPISLGSRTRGGRSSTRGLDELPVPITPRSLPHPNAKPVEDRSVEFKAPNLTSRPSTYSKSSRWEQRLKNDAEFARKSAETQHSSRSSTYSRSSSDTRRAPIGGGSREVNSERPRRRNENPFETTQIPNSFQTRHGGPAPSAFLTRTPAGETPGETFSSPPLMPGLAKSLQELLGTNAKPTPIQAMSMQNLLNLDPSKYVEALLASETGSGKSIAYLLPLLQALKQLEIDGTLQRQITHPLNPRALILAPSHELTRQLATFAKSLIHEIKLRVMCASRANTNNKVDTIGGTASQMKHKIDMLFGDGEDFQVRAEGRYPVDVLVSTPMKMLEMVKGRGWEHRIGEKVVKAEDDADKDESEHKNRDIDIGNVVKTGRNPAQVGLLNIEWVIVDEADVLFDPDFQESTRLLLSEIASARGKPTPYYPDEFNYRQQGTPIVPKPVSYPFNLVLTSATIPSALGSYLDIHHPKHLRLASPKLHHLPSSLQKEYVGWTGGNKLADIEKRIRRVWSEDSISRDGKLSKVLVFCNKKTKVRSLAEHLEAKGLKAVAIDGSPESRGKGSNHHLDGFLRVPNQPKVATEEGASDPEKTPHVLITTSLLSRGIDFSPDIKHVFIVDEPRNMTDFIHRAGRSARAGNQGKVVIFGKMEGRGSGRAKEVRRQVAALT